MVKGLFENLESCLNSDFLSPESGQDEFWEPAVYCPYLLHCGHSGCAERLPVLCVVGSQSYLAIDSGQ